MDDLDLSTAVDLAEGYAARLRKEAKPFERVTEVLRAALNAQALLRDADTRLAALETEEHATRNRLQSLSLQLPLLEADVAEARQHTTTTLDDLRRQMTEATQAAQEVIREAEASAAAKLAQLEADYAAREDVLRAEVDALLLQKTTLTETIEAVKAQVAALTKG